VLLALPLLAGLIVGKLTGGSFRRLASVNLRAPWLFLLGLGIQVFLYNPWIEQQSWDIRYGHLLYVGSLLLLFAALLMNLSRVRWPLWILVTGAGVNLVVILANGGAMPVDAHLLALAQGNQLVWQIAHHHLASNVMPVISSARLAFFDDHLALARSVYSIGDVLIGVGGFLIAIVEMRGSPRVSSVGSGDVSKTRMPQIA